MDSTEAGYSLAECLLPVVDAESLTELREAVRQTVARYLGINSSQAKVYLKNPVNDQLVDDHNRQLPSSCFLSEVLSQRGKTVISASKKEDCITDLLGNNHSNDSNGGSHVFLLPIPERGTHKANGLVVVESQSSNISNTDTKRLELCVKQASVTYEAIKARGTISTKADSDTTPASLFSLIQLCSDLNDQDTGKLQQKVMRYLCRHIGAEIGFILLLVPETQELFCQAVGDTLLQDEIRFDGAHSDFAQALESRQPISFEDLLPEGKVTVEKIAGVTLKSFLCVPVTVADGKELLALTCMINKENDQQFTDGDTELIRQCFKYTSTVISSTLAFQNERKLKNQTQALLQVAKKLFTRLDDLTKLLREIMQEARNLTDAERCSVFLIDKDTDELVAMVFDGITAEDKERLMRGLRTRQDAKQKKTVQGEIRLPKTQGIAGHVATTGTLLNIRDAYSHPLFYRGIDDSTGFRTRNILCFPIKDEEGVVLGVAQLCNKKTFQYFTTFDEDIASAFAVYCCISISHSLMYKKVIDIQYRNSLANELMMFHMKSLMYKKLQDTQHRQRLANELMMFHLNQQVPGEEVTSMANMTIPRITQFSPNFDSFDFPPRSIPESQTVLSCMAMFEDLGFMQRWRIKLDTLVRFVLMVKKGYRNPPYHNWMHAYAVTHFCYLLIKNLHLHKYLEDIEMLALFVSCMCHDIDHRGTTNSFQVQSQTVLAALYSSEGSVMERHHLAQSMCILNTEGSNLFEQLSSKEYQTVLDMMKEIILATDLAHHLRTVKEQEKMATSGTYSKANPNDRYTLLCLLMTACDLSDQTKNWKNTKLIASLVYQEFFSQGDLEKALGKNPLEMMDRERACIPELQIAFLDNIAAPVYKILVQMFPEAEVVQRNVEDNRKHWVHIRELLQSKHGKSVMSVDQIISMEENPGEARKGSDSGSSMNNNMEDGSSGVESRSSSINTNNNEDNNNSTSAQINGQ